MIIEGGLQERVYEGVFPAGMLDAWAHGFTTPLLQQYYIANGYKPYTKLEHAQSYAAEVRNRKGWVVRRIT